MTTELQTLIAEREAINDDLTVANERWEACNAKIIALVAKYKVGDIAPFQRGGKEFRLSVSRVSIACNYTHNKRLFVQYAGQLVRKDGTVGTMGGSFAEYLEGQ